MDIIDTSADRPCVEMSPEKAEAMELLRDYLFDAVYRNPTVKSEESKAAEMLAILYDHYTAHPDQLPELYRDPALGSPERRVCDYIAGMSDVYALCSLRRAGTRHNAYRRILCVYSKPF